MSDEGQGPELEFGLNLSSPLMLSPTNELSNPFFSLTTGDLSQALILDFGMNSQIGTKHSLTPQELPLSLDYFDKDYFSMAASIKRQRVNQHPTRSSSSSLASSTSSATPSEADSDLLERGMSEEDATMMRVDNFSASPFGNHQNILTTSVGLGFNLGYDQLSHVDLSHSKSSLTIKSESKTEYNEDDADRQFYQQHLRQQHTAIAITPPSHATVALNAFNLSDFISDQEQEQQHQVAMEARSALFMTPERSMAHRDASKLMVRSNTYSPASSLSSQASGVEHFKSSPLNDGTGERSNVPDELFGGQGPQGHLFERPGLSMRAFSGNVETLSCNPAHITPSHERRSSDQVSIENLQSSNSYFGSSPSVGHNEVAQKLFNNRDNSCASPLSQFSSPSQSHYNLFNGDDHRGDVFHGSSSPGIFQDGKPLMLSYSAPPSHQKQEGQLYESDARSGGVMRSCRTAVSQQSSPYQSPALEQNPFDSQGGRRMSIDGQMIPGIITKRSRGRRVPNNPEELNNLGKSGKVYTCKVPGCGKCFKRSEHLKRHVRSIHTDEKPYTCHCGKTFSRHDNLNQHARVHLPGGMDSPSSQDASLSPAGSPMSLPSAFAKTHLDSKHISFNIVNSRLRQAINQEGEEEEDEEVLDDDVHSEAEMLALKREDRRTLRQ